MLSEPLIGKKNLLAFSYGVDSSALFFMLVERGIDFDMAMVNYNMRTSSLCEVKEAQKLALRYNKKLYLHEVSMPKGANFEMRARTIRYDFFDSLMPQYDNLILAHQLNDQLEWFLMQLSKGSGVVELLGMQPITQRHHYQIVRPLLALSKEQLEAYLQEREELYFVDESNFDLSLQRNYFRHHFSDRLIQEFSSGIARSFAYLHRDKAALFPPIAIIELQKLYIFKASAQEIRYIDKIAKKLGVVLSLAQKEAYLRDGGGVFSHKIAICKENRTIFIAPFVKITMPKSFKERCRVEKIPKWVRGYIYHANLSLDDIKNEVNRL